MAAKNIIAYEEHVAGLYGLLEQVEHSITASGFNRNLNHLVKLRASQMNGCGFCVKMHTSEARRDGETDRRLDRLIVWRHVDDFSKAERAAFAWTEALTNVVESTDYNMLRTQLLEHYSEQDISVLTSIIAMINLWNRLGVSKH